MVSDKNNVINMCKQSFERQVVKERYSVYMHLTKCSKIHIICNCGKSILKRSDTVCE